MKTLSLIVLATVYANAPIKSVDLYKNGFAALTRYLEPNKGKVTLFAPEALPAYGTFWHNSDSPLTVRTITEKPFCTVSFTASSALSQIIALAQKSSTMVINATMDYSSGEAKNAIYTLKGNCDFTISDNTLELTLESGAKVNVIRDNVVAIDSPDQFTLDTAPIAWCFEGAKAPFYVQYLTQGAVWAPSYRLELKDDEEATLAMTAEIRNEIADWQDVELRLVSGFPSIKYANTVSLLGSNINGFLNNSGDLDDGGVKANRLDSGRRMMALGGLAKVERVADYAASPMNNNLEGYAAKETNEGADVNYREVGLVTLKKGEALAIPLGLATTGYKRIVDWRISATRDSWGRLNNNNNSQELWDAIKFNNPFSFPLSSGAIEVVEDNRILGEAKCEWTNPQDETLVKITKALSVKGSYEEESENKNASSKLGSFTPGEQVEIEGRKYFKEPIKAKITLQNFRATDALVVVKKVFTGEITAVSLPAKTVKSLPVRDFGINGEVEHTWEVALKPNEKREITINYWLWVRK